MSVSGAVRVIKTEMIIKEIEDCILRARHSSVAAAVNRAPKDSPAAALPPPSLFCFPISSVNECRQTVAGSEA